MSYGRIGLLAAMAMMSMGAAAPRTQRFTDDSDVPGYLRRPRSQAKQRLIRRRRGKR